MLHGKVSRTARSRLTSCCRVLRLHTAILFSGAFPALASCPPSEWVDPDTPAEACSGQVDSAGRPLTLVFSDEFNVAGRTFADGHDPAWTAITGFPSSNDQENAYDDSPSHVTTSHGNLWLRISKTESFLEVVNGTTGLKEMKQRPYTSAMLQSWNKFCFTGGVVEISAKFPGEAELPGLWPAFWLLGNLGRATVETSVNNVWPYSYSQCPAGQNSEANQDPKKQQLINECLGSNWTERFGLRPHQGRGAIEIDILEVLPGKDAPNYREDKVLTGLCEPLADYSKLDMPRPHLLNTLQAAPGIPVGADQRPREGNESCVPIWGKEWYSELRQDNPQVYGPDTTINYYNYGKYVANVNPWTDVELQVDSMGAMTHLTKSAFEKHHVYRFEWSTQGDGELIFWMDGKLLFRLDAALLARQFEVTRGDKPLGTMLARQLLLEPVSMILNIDVSRQWGWDIFEKKCPKGSCGCCLDCKNPKCIACMLQMGQEEEYMFLSQMCRTLPATFEVDYIRVFQTQEQQAKDHEGCSPKAAPTQGWVDTRPEKYVVPNFDAPLAPIYAGGARCQTDANCGSISGSGTCLRGVCNCSEGWTGPSCLARVAGTAKTCRPLELALVGGGPCDVNSTLDRCGHGHCVKINHDWKMPWQTVAHQHMEKPVGTGNGRCKCDNGWAGPFCSNIAPRKEELKWKQQSCVPRSTMSSPDLEKFIRKVCDRRLSHRIRASSQVVETCREILWQHGGLFSQCGAWPRASWLAKAVKAETGLCCTRLDDQGREVCAEDDSEFGLLAIIAGLVVLFMAFLGCVRQSHIQGRLCAGQKRRRSANFNHKEEHEDTSEDELDEIEVNGYGGSASEDSK